MTALNMRATNKGNLFLAKVKYAIPTETYIPFTAASQSYP
jgi:hypothetical protein